MVRIRLYTSIRGAIGKASLAHGTAYRLKANVRECTFADVGWTRGRANRLATFWNWRLSERLSRLFIVLCHIR